MVGSDTTELTSRLALVRPVHTVRGLAFNAILHLVAERAGGEVSARLSREANARRLVDFFSYPASDFISTVGCALAKLMDRKNPMQGFANTSIAYAT